MNLASVRAVRLLKDNETLKNASASVFVFGSIRRGECLPQGDVDVVLHVPVDDDLRDAREALECIGRECNMDKVDVLHVDESTALHEIAEGRSPDAGYLDVVPVTVTPYGAKVSQVLKECCEEYNRPSQLALRLICEYYFSRKFNDRSVGDEINLKYTPGGYRDILFLDLYSRIVQGEGMAGVDAWTGN